MKHLIDWARHQPELAAIVAIWAMLFVALTVVGVVGVVMGRW